ncbi:hypothetical protein [Pelosinus propionicus]|uniref:Uncharacterized protein n=1 Tax=Pelosinus propionicus DSM 13327 TaxID=1123291 RepID=A0A1I4JHM4_9FIRM|nr:hypothetical protein [Pelosinus propionicus]SFL65707.1 hypothetical protein SAMN04490355_101272 [Pelosinus propionicus DSM 13327]
MEETEFDDEEVTDSMEESLDELRELESEEITANDDYNLDDQENLSSEVILTPKKTRRKKLVIPLSATPLEVFMLTYDFTIAEVASVTKLSQDTLLDIIRGDMPTEYQKQRVRLTTGVKL